MVAPPEIKWIGSPNFYKDRTDHYGRRWTEGPKAIICHISAGTMAGMDSWFKNPASEASAHFGISKTGEIHQYVDLKDGAWANGAINKGTWPLLKEYPGWNPNLYTISIEHEGNHPNAAKGQFWTPTEAQLQASIRLIAWLCWKFNIPVDRVHIAGHYEIDAVNRPYCPGPLFPFDKIITEVKKLLVKEAATMLFSDIKGHWAEKYIMDCANRKTPSGEPLLGGSVTADGSRVFRPDQPITRAEVATVISRLLSIIDAK